MSPVLPVTVVTSTDPVSRDLATAAVVCDVPGAVVLRYDLGPRGSDGLRRVVSDLSGVVEDVVVPLEHACLGCAQRDDVLPTVAAVAASGRWSALVLALPVGADPAPLLQALCTEEELRRAVTVRGVVATAPAAHLLDDLLGDALLSERGLALGEDDDRAVGEALAQQLDEADLVLTDGPPDQRTRSLLAHLCGPAVAVRSLQQADGAQLTTPLGASHRTGARADPRSARRQPVPDANGVWTVELSSPRALHPARLLERIEDLGAGRLRARGTFWLPTRPGTVCAWDGAGGQLSIGDIGRVDLVPSDGLPSGVSPDGVSPGAGERRTHLVVTGTEPDERERLRRAFADVLTTPAEEARAQDAAVDQGGDGFEAWLGPLGEREGERISVVE